MSEELFVIKDLNFHYQLGQTQIEALKKVNLKISEGEFICFAGPSGSGKSTLLNLIGFIELTQNDHIQFRKKSVHKLNNDEVNQIRLFDLGFIFQHFNLFNILTVFENVEYFMIQQGKPAEERSRMVESCLRKVGLWEHCMKRPMELSGGQKQRVAIARALAKCPKIIIADEPTASLDQQTGREILDLLLKLNREDKVTIIMSSHDPMVLELSPKIYRLKDGELFS